MSVFFQHPVLSRYFSPLARWADQLALWMRVRTHFSSETITVHSFIHSLRPFL